MMTNVNNNEIETNDFLGEQSKLDYLLSVPDAHCWYKTITNLTDSFSLNSELDYSENEKISCNDDVSDSSCDFSTHLLPSMTDDITSKMADASIDKFKWKVEDKLLYSSRLIAKQLIKNLNNLGYTLYSACEYEFSLYKDLNQGGDGLASRVADPNILVPAHSTNEVFSLSLMNEYKQFFIQFHNRLQKLGIVLEDMQIEYGLGQLEATMQPEFDLKSADNSIIYKETVRECAFSNGYHSTFMAKPIFKQPGNGCHFNHSIWKIESNGEKQNVFYDANNREHYLSEFGQHWLAGLMEHTPALTALFCPTVNCYRRLHQPRTPTTIYWKFDDRSACYRVKSGFQKTVYIENRIPSPSSNPYLLLAGVVAAGIDGITRQLELPRPGTAPKGKLPTSLSDAMDELASDEVIKKAIGKEFVDAFIKLKRNTKMLELSSVDPTKNTQKHLDLEKQLYFYQV